MKSIQAVSAPKFLSATVSALVVLASEAEAQNAAKQWRVQDGGNGHWYAARRWDFPKSWPEARDAAVARGGQLACVTSAAESQWLGANMTLEQPGCGLGRMGWHLGGYQDRSATGFAEPSGGWRWISGEPWEFTAWLTESNYPNLSGGNRPNNFGGNEQYLKMSELPYAPWWDDVGTTSDQQDMCGAIIEWSADCNGDGVVDFGQCHDGTLADYDGNNIPDCCERGEACEIGMYPVQWRSSEGGNGHWYQGALPPSAGVSWSGARSIAQGRGGDLVSLNTSQERSWVFEHVSGDPRLWTVTLGPWAGGYQPDGSPEPGGGWMWVDGTPVAEDFFWNKWHPDGNDNCGGPANRMSYWGMYVAGAGDLFADCADLQRATCWNIDFGFHPSLVVEWSADCDNDGQVDIGQILRGEALDANANGVPDHCEISCSDADLYANGEVNGADLGVLLSEWGVAAPGSRSDIDGDGLVNGVDLAYILAFWGPCGG